MDLKELEYEAVNWIQMVKGRDEQRALVSIAIDFRGSIKYGIFLSS
jgi:hypothetical protein